MKNQPKDITTNDCRADLPAMRAGGAEVASDQHFINAADGQERADALDVIDMPGARLKCMCLDK